MFAWGTQPVALVFDGSELSAAWETISKRVRQNFGGAQTTLPDRVFPGQFPTLAFPAQCHLWNSSVTTLSFAHCDEDGGQSRSRISQAMAISASIDNSFAQKVGLEEIDRILKSYL